MMVQIMEGKWQNVQMTADYKVMRIYYTGLIFSTFPDIFYPDQSKSIPSALMAFFQGRDYTASLTAGNPDLLGGSGMAVAHYLQVIGYPGLLYLVMGHI